MKRIIAIVLVVLCLGAAVAYAAKAGTASVTKQEPLPGVPVFDKVKEGTDEILERHLMDKIALTAVGGANRLSDEDKEAFLKEYNTVKDMKDGKVLYCFHSKFKPGQEVELNEGEEFRITFSVRGVREGDDVVVRLNGKELAADKVKAGNGTITVWVKELGVFTFIKK